MDICSSENVGSCEVTNEGFMAVGLQEMGEVVTIEQIAAPHTGHDVSLASGQAVPGDTVIAVALTVIVLIAWGIFRSFSNR